MIGDAIAGLFIVAFGYGALRMVPVIQRSYRTELMSPAWLDRARRHQVERGRW